MNSGPRPPDGQSAGEPAPGRPTGSPADELASPPPAFRAPFDVRLLDAIEAAIVVTDLEGLILYWNAAAELATLGC